MSQQRELSIQAAVKRRRRRGRSGWSVPLLAFAVVALLAVGSLLVWRVRQNNGPGLAVPLQAADTLRGEQLDQVLGEQRLGSTAAAGPDSSDPQLLRLSPDAKLKRARTLVDNMERIGHFSVDRPTVETAVLADETVAVRFQYRIVNDHGETVVRKFTGNWNGDFSEVLQNDDSFVRFE
jgi:hypothetical protein